MIFINCSADSASLAVIPELELSGNCCSDPCNRDGVNLGSNNEMMDAKKREGIVAAERNEIAEVSKLN